MMAFQVYNIHLNNGMVIAVEENYDIPFEKGVVAEYKRIKDNDFLALGNCVNGFVYVLKKNIAYISTGNVKVVSK